MLGDRAAQAGLTGPVDGSGGVLWEEWLGTVPHPLYHRRDDDGQVEYPADRVAHGIHEGQGGCICGA